MFSSSGALMLHKTQYCCNLGILVQKLLDVCIVCLGSSVDRGAKAVKAVARQGNGSVRPVSSAVPRGSRPRTARHLLHSRRWRKGELVILITNILLVLHTITLLGLSMNISVRVVSLQTEQRIYLSRVLSLPVV